MGRTAAASVKERWASKPMTCEVHTTKTGIRAREGKGGQQSSNSGKTVGSETNPVFIDIS